VLDEARVLPPRFGLQDAGLDIHVLASEKRNSAAIDERVGIDGGHDHPGEARRGDPRRTWRGPSLMRAWLERDVEGGPRDSVPGLVHGDDLRVRTARALVPSLAEHLSVADDHRADQGVR
jgi:hypothetical protein